ncbi:TRAP transporter DctM subunit [Hyphomonas adhaerens MHS-3]|uniref:TRAP transporter large permease protein n=1 Tax=Hyphomonas adhaerens MHS-3 TaxID=1280949 RepID=A0A069E9N5_9PROT|nr:TRAP transporter large permease [Hyphomonas adhaerens]KCZ86191.1 TRAP transporter DctM subunit [Hyphomonas adhaerens MHS-3]
MSRIAAFIMLLLTALLGVGLAYVMGVAGILGFYVAGLGDFLQALPRRAFSQLDVFALMAMPLFVLVGELMNRGGITRSLINLASLVVGRSRGGLGHVNVASSVFFAGVSGSAMADAAALSSTLVPAMKENGYSGVYAGAITAASSVIGPLIPPSIILIFYGAIMNVDVAALFAASIVPGLLLSLALFAANAIFARLHNHPSLNERPPFFRTVRKAGPAMLLPFIIIAGIVFGVVTPTEAAALAVVTALLIIALGGELKLANVKEAVFGATIFTGAIFAIIFAAASINFLAAVVGAPAIIAAWLDAHALSLNTYLAVLTIIFILVGMVLDTQIALILLAPILVPAAYTLGADPVHLGVIVCFTITLGLITPPLGGVVLIVSAATRESYWALMKVLMPFILIEFAVLFLLLYVPDIVLTLPRVLGLL